MVAAGNEIYVFGPGGLEAQADVGKFFGVYSAAKSVLTNLIVLTEGTAQGTAGKEDCSASAENCYERLFAKVKSRKSNAEVSGLAAKATPVVELVETTCSINSTLAGALPAVPVELV